MSFDACLVHFGRDCLARWNTGTPVFNLQRQTQVASQDESPVPTQCYRDRFTVSVCARPRIHFQAQGDVRAQHHLHDLTTASINAGFNGGKYDGSPADNAKAFTDHWNATGYKSLREMVDPIAPDYGKSIQTVDPIDVTGYTEMWWQNDEYKEGFIASHSGPCEAWIDDVRIFHHDNCAAEFTSYPAKVPADYSSCKGDCLFSFYWLALHEPNWQIYKQCVPITNSGSSTTTQSSGSSEAVASDDGDSETEQTTTTAPVVTTSIPTATTATPETSTSDGSSIVTQADASTANEASSGEQMDTTTPAPEATTVAPDVATETPVYTPEATEAAPSSGKCVRRRS